MFIKMYIKCIKLIMLIPQEQELLTIKTCLIFVSLNFGLFLFRNR